MSEQAQAIPQPIGVLLADDEPMMRQSLRMVIDSQPDLRVVGEATTGTEAVRVARSLRPEIVLMDIRMPGSDGIHATQAITADPALQCVRVLVLSMYELDEYVYGALQAGASGFLLKDAHPAVLLQAIRRAHAGESLFAPAILAKLVEHYVSTSRPALHSAHAPALDQLTRRETEVLSLVARGFSNEQLARELHISANTVKTHIGSLLAKLDARDRAQLVITAYETGVAAISQRT